MLVLVLLTIILTMSCDPGKKFEKEENEKIQQYIQENGITETPTESGLYYIETLAGTGATPVAGDSVVLYYTGKLIEGTVFDTNLTKDPLGFVMGTFAVIEGFEEGLSYMKKGGAATLLMPSSLAYGPNGTYWGIPGYSPIIFDVELVDIIPASTKK
jgi:FKBP-type peptidyl-prolyl cis-trans isomerase FkpA